MTNLVRSEFRKLLTVKAWWIAGLGFLAFFALSLAINIGMAVGELRNSSSDVAVGIAQTTNVYTSGQWFGTLFVMLLGVLMVTNEYHHQTATPTFLASPRRVDVIVSKLLAALVVGAAYALVATVLSVLVGGIWISGEGFATHLGDPEVVGALLLNMLAYGIWAVVGVGIGTLIRHQVGAVLVAIVLKVVAELTASGVLLLLSHWLGAPWIQNLRYALPSVASRVMTKTLGEPNAPEWYTGALVLIAWGLVAAAIGSVLTKRRDIT